jgi:hypothetical protein
MQSVLKVFFIFKYIPCSRSLQTSSASSPTSASYRADTSEFVVPSHQHLKHQLLHQHLHQHLHQLLLRHLLPPQENVERMQNGSRRELLEGVLPTLMSGPGLLLWCTKTDEGPGNTAEQLSSRTPMFSLPLTASNRSSNPT